jgi:polygalacturonase
MSIQPARNFGKSGSTKRNLQRLVPALMIAAAARSAYAQYAVPALPTIGSATYNAGVSDSAIGTSNVLTAGTTSTIATNNTTVLNDYITYASTHGGGTVVIPTGSYDANEILMKNNVDLDVQTGATLVNFTPLNTFVTGGSGATGNIELSGGGVLDDNATTKTSNNKMVFLEGLTNIEVANVSIEDASNEHLVAECDNNLTINNVTIADPNTLTANSGKYLANTDGIDFSGTNVLIENCNIADGDDNLVAKPDTTTANGITAYTANVNVENINITAGHGISIGGQTNAGLNGMYVNNVTETGAGTNSTSRIEQGIHLKAGDGAAGSNNQNGGLVQNVTFNNMTMTNVDDALVINSYYNDGDDNFPTIPAASAPTDSTEPLWENITMENITVVSAVGSAAEIYGLNSSPANTIGLNIQNINVINSGSAWKMYYSTGVYFNNVNVRGAMLPDSESDVKNSGGVSVDDEQFDSFVSAGSASPIYTPPLAIPEPMSASLMLGASGLLAFRRPRKTIKLPIIDE